MFSLVLEGRRYTDRLILRRIEGGFVVLYIDNHKYHPSKLDALLNRNIVPENLEDVFPEHNENVMLAEELADVIDRNQSFFLNYRLI